MIYITINMMPGGYGDVASVVRFFVIQLGCKSRSYVILILLLSYFARHRLSPAPLDIHRLKKVFDSFVLYKLIYIFVTTLKRYDSELSLFCSKTTNNLLDG